MKNKIQAMIITGVFTTVPFESSWAKVPLCTEAPSYSQARNFEDFDASRLPHEVLVARVAEVWVANKDRGLKLFLRQNFKSMASEVKCSKAPYEGSMNLSVWIPTLLDFSGEKSWGDSIWQVQALSTNSKVGVWSQKSKLAPVNEAKKISEKGIWRPGGLDSYELIWDQVEGNTVYSIRVVYDILRS